MKPNDKRILTDALASNGGGIDLERYPNASGIRMLKAGFLQLKPGQNKSGHHRVLFTLTSAGKAEAERLSNALADQVPR